jgi:F0F1-type ATP synthase epsilon subunit
MKITEEELNKLKEQETKKNQIALEMGALDYKKHKLSKLLDDIVELQEMTLEEIDENYGKININLENGEYEKIEEEQTE